MKTLHTLTPMTVTAAYDPAPQLPQDLQTITVYGPPAYIMSPRIRLYRAEDIMTFRGYLSRFGPVHMEGEVPEARIVITPTPPTQEELQHGS